MEESLNILAFHLRFLSVLGVMASDQFVNSAPRWKQLLYNLYQLLPFLILAPVLLGQILALYRYWGDIALTCDNAGQIAMVMLCLHPRAHISLTASHVRNLAKDLEHCSVLTSDIVQSDPRIRVIVDRTKRNVNILTKFLSFGITISTILWFGAPFLLNQYGDENLDTSTESPRQVFMKDGVHKLHFIMYLPIDMEAWLVEIYILQGLLFYFGYFSIMTSGLFLTSMFMRIMAEFEGLANAIQYIDELEEEETQYGETKMEPLVHVGKPRTAKGYLTELIKLHLVAMKFAARFEEMISVPGLTVQVSFITVITVSLYMITLLWEKAIKFVFIVILVLSETLIVTSIGEMVSLQSEKVGDELYNSQWYRRSSPFKRHLLIMLCRSQIPIELKVAKLVKIRLLLFADISHTCYKIFALLLQLHND